MQREEPNHTKKKKRKKKGGWEERTGYAGSKLWVGSDLMKGHGKMWLTTVNTFFSFSPGTSSKL